MSWMDEFRAIAKRTLEDGHDTPCSIGFGGELSSNPDGTEPTGPVRPGDSARLVSRYATIVLMYHQGERPDLWERWITEHVAAGRFKEGVNLKVEPEKGTFRIETRSRGSLLATDGVEVDLRNTPTWWFEGTGEPEAMRKFLYEFERNNFFVLALLFKDVAFSEVFDGNGNFVAGEKGIPPKIHTLDGEY